VPSQRIDKALWVGTLFNHQDPVYNVYRNRQEVFNGIQEHVQTFKQLTNEDFKNWLKICKIGIDLVGVGDPNKRLFEILESGALLMTMTTNLIWPFPNNERFAEEVYFSTADEFIVKSKALLTNSELYQKALSVQNSLIEKYFTKEWLSSYILDKAGLQEKDIPEGQKYCTKILTQCIRERKPVAFVKLGDGEYNCANFHTGINCDSDNYTPKKGLAIINTLAFLNHTKDNVYFGLWWNSANRRFWEECCTRPIHWTNYHSLIIDDNDIDTKSESLKEKIELYKEIKKSTMKKVFICNVLLQKLKNLLNIDSFVHVPLSNWFDTEFERILEEAKKEYDENGTIYMFACGMGGKPLIGELFKCFPNAICLDIGSALDFICTQRDSRGNRYKYAQIKEVFQELLPEDWEDSRYDELVSLAKVHLGKHLPQ
jgi:hypothetical protein